MTALSARTARILRASASTLVLGFASLSPTAAYAQDQAEAAEETKPVSAQTDPDAASSRRLKPPRRRDHRHRPAACSSERARHQAQRRHGRQLDHGDRHRLFPGQVRCRSAAARARHHRQPFRSQQRHRTLLGRALGRHRPRPSASPFRVQRSRHVQRQQLARTELGDITPERWPASTRTRTRPPK